MSKQPALIPVKVPDALMSAMGFTVAELKPGSASDITASPGSLEENDGHHPWFVDSEDREFHALAPKLTACLAAGRAAYNAKLAEVGDIGTAGFVWVAIEITPETKPAIRWLNEGDHGRIDGWSLHFRIDPRGFLAEDDRLVQSMTVQEAGCEALAAALREASCPCRVDGRLD